MRKYLLRKLNQTESLQRRYLNFPPTIQPVGRYVQPLLLKVTGVNKDKFFTNFFFLSYETQKQFTGVEVKAIASTKTTV